MEKLIRLQHNEKTYRFVRETTKRTNFMFGSAGSGKSWSIAQHLLFDKLLTEKDIRILVTRKTRPALKKSAWLLMNDLISHYEVPITEKNKSDLMIGYHGNEMYFTPIDDPEKLKSFEKINYVWGEEATEYTKIDYIQLGLRCRGKNANGRNKLIFSFNPVDEQSYLKGLTDNPGPNMAVNHSTYKDNAFLDQDYIDQIEELKRQDATYWKIYGLGMWATPENMIYTNWDVVEAFPVDCDEIGYGVDFGFNNQTAVVRIGVKDQEVYEQELLYESKLTNNDLIERMQLLIPNKLCVMRADAAEPQRIKEIYDAGFNIHAATKGKDSVKVGIDRVKRRRTHITRDSANLIAEKKGYKWKEDRNGNVLDEPVKFRDHLMDAERYYLGEEPIEQMETVMIGEVELE